MCVLYEHTRIEPAEGSIFICVQKTRVGDEGGHMFPTCNSSLFLILPHRNLSIYFLQEVQDYGDDDQERCTADS